MSASEKKTARDEKRRQEEQKDRRSTTLYTVVAVVVIVAAVVLMIWNNGFLQRSFTALEINGVKYTAADVQYYYNSVYSSYAQQYAFDSSASVKKQVYDEATGQTWYDYLMDLTVESMTNNAALAQQAREEGFALTEESQSQLDSFAGQLDTAWITSNYTSRAALIKASYGPYMTYDRLMELAGQELLAGDYAQSKLDAIDHPDSDYQAYYKEHADELDTVTYTQLLFRAVVPTTDADGNTIELTDAEKASQLETLKAEQKALAEEVKAKLEGGADPEELSEEYGDKIYSTSLSSHSTGSSLALYTTYGDWLLDSARKAGDVTLTERETSSTCFYYVVVFEGRALDQERTHDVRHILVRAGDGSADPTQAEYDEAETKAQDLLDEWKAGEATEDSFAALATANTDDTSSASSGGLYAGITSSSSYVDAFKEWATDSARRAGDTGLVKTEYGWHIMYYVTDNDPVWKQNTAVALQNQDYEQLAAGAAQGWTVSRGIGMNFISA